MHSREQAAGGKQDAVRRPPPTKTHGKHQPENRSACSAAAITIKFSVFNELFGHVGMCFPKILRPLRSTASVINYFTLVNQFTAIKTVYNPPGRQRAQPWGAKNSGKEISIDGGGSASAQEPLEPFAGAPLALKLIKLALTRKLLRGFLPALWMC